MLNAKLRFPSFKRIGTTTRIAFAMAMWTGCVLLGLRLCGVINDGHERLLSQRTKLCESVAVGCSQLISTNGDRDAALMLESLAARNSDVISAGIRSHDGSLLHATADHELQWSSALLSGSMNQILVPVMRGRDVFARLEVAFVSPVQAGVLGFFSMPSVKITVIATLLNLLGFSIWLRRCFRHLDPSQVVPERVRAALDNMAEVILVVDNRGQLMLVNQRLADVLGNTPDSYQGRSIHSLPWSCGAEFLNDLQSRVHDQKITLRITDGDDRTYKLNCSPIVDEQGTARGTILSLDDITLLESQRLQLQATLVDLRKSQEEIAEQNEQLKYLATRDPMTGCYNRRSFFDTFASAWSASVRYGHSISCVMVDVDHFKSINDQHGHATGDEVLKRVAEAILHTARDSDTVCRYGGEEFCVLLPHVDVDGARQAAERIRAAIAALEFPELSVTASLGCSDRNQGADQAEAMLDQADQALYKAKRGGRNRVCTYDQAQSRSDASTPPELEALATVPTNVATDYAAN